MQTVTSTHIYLDKKGIAWIDDTNIKVIEVALDKRAYGWSPEEIHEQHPHLTLAQIHAALSYYYDHQAEIDAEIERQDKEIVALMEKANDSPLKKRLRSMPQKLDKSPQAIADKDGLIELSAEDEATLTTYCAKWGLSRKQAISKLLAEILYFSKQCDFGKMDLRPSTEEQEKRRA